MPERGPDFRLWKAGRVVFRDTEGVTVECPVCGLVGAQITHIPGMIVHIGAWEPVPGRPQLSRLVAYSTCGVKTKKT